MPLCPAAELRAQNEKQYTRHRQSNYLPNSGAGCKSYGGTDVNRKLYVPDSWDYFVSMGRTASRGRSRLNGSR